MIDITKFDGHTAGPWQEDAFVGVFYSADDTMIASMADGADADYRLIAAAPDLLAEVIRLRAEVAALKGGEA